MGKKIVCISALSQGSTGKIMQGISNEATLSGDRVKMFVSTNKKPLYKSSDISDINSSLGNRVAIYLNKLTGLEGCFAFFATLNLLKKIEKYKPDIIHLHILHHGYINLPLLFRFLKKKAIPVVWTLHDCWAFTGHCPHFEYEKCNKWKTGCFKCPRYNQYPLSLYDNSKFMWKLKRKWFSNLFNLTIVVPSHWLGNAVEESFLGNYRREIIFNGVDLSVFVPRESDFREKYGIGDKKIVLGVSSVWNKKKGLDVFVELADRLPDEYQIVMVGTNNDIDKQLPANIISISHTNNQKQLAEIYTAADIFVNPTREEVLGLVNIEALACGIPVVTFDAGGSSECLNEFCGKVVPCDDIEALEKEIKYICENKIYSKNECRKRALYFDKNKRFAEYQELYHKIITE